MLRDYREQPTTISDEHESDILLKGEVIPACPL